MELCNDYHALSLDNKGVSHPAADTKRCKSTPGIDALHLVQQCHKNPRTACANGMADGNCTAIMIYFCGVNSQFFNTADSLRGKGLVQFPVINVFNFKPCFF